MNKLISIYHTGRFWILITFLSIILGLLAFFAGFVDNTGNLSHRISSLWCRLLCKLNGVEVEIDGLENILSDKPQIFVSNHQGYFDIFALSGYLPVQIRWVAKSSLFKIPFMGWAMKASGYIPVERGDRKKAFEAFNKTLEKLKEGSSIIIFPEGTRSEDGEIGPFKKGSNLIASRSKCPMVPVTIIGSGHIIKKGSAVITPGSVQIVISPLVEPRSDKKGNEEVLESIRETIVATQRDAGLN
ncbi:MAG: 1-acyl-sn-glycerol-3-phosphate acyltransferase [Nitrospina sp.]|nr:1-acyl-sn-glycerol-3-phosphate acyltransferase [Nitrospina sp.]MBT3877042.1 1-acyl-sn-glycerol-3-phosphate acyltransferase [Nitrospina sp.]MBT4048313.1 1-acyl-sn-glycerol-3-phosphate acyltransferase [Nitrospina sp.]MBT4558242.1 1-acyl-sn-glycerol-3-phosphate acyltransferase [Nitrospina sp.]MBT5348525.1 1-acyl-sn-glycerol-3-phosphate acyltransferase [Nitrospina sp.]